MPYKNPKDRKAANRKAQAKRREGVTDKRASPPAASPPDVTPDGRVIETVRWTDADGQAQTTRYTGPRADWKGLGWCVDCNTKVAAKDNCCRVCFFEPEKAVIPPLGPIAYERFPQFTTKPAWASRPDKRALPDLAAISKSLAEANLGAHVRFGWQGPTFAEIAKVLT